MKEDGVEKLNLNAERRPSKEGKRIIKLFQEAKMFANDEEIKDFLWQKFAERLVAAVTPKGERPHVGEMLYSMKDIALGGKRDDKFYIGSGTAGQRIIFENHTVIPRGDTKTVERLEREAKKVYEAPNLVEFESADGKPRWMRYPKPEGESWKFGKDYWERYMETFGDETVDLLEDIPEQTGSDENINIDNLKKAVFTAVNQKEGGVLIMSEKEYAFAMRLQKKYPDYYRYRAYHQLIGSTPPDNVLDGDFEGEDSVEDFYQSLLKEFGGSNA